MVLLTQMPPGFSSLEGGLGVTCPTFSAMQNLLYGFPATGLHSGWPITAGLSAHDSGRPALQSPLPDELKPAVDEWREAKPEGSLRCRGAGATDTRTAVKATSRTGLRKPMTRGRTEQRGEGRGEPGRRAAFLFLAPSFCFSLYIPILPLVT